MKRDLSEMFRDSVNPNKQDQIAPDHVKLCEADQPLSQIQDLGRANHPAISPGDNAEDGEEERQEASPPPSPKIVAPQPADTRRAMGMSVFNSDAKFKVEEEELDP